jgi:hypothetical protein
MKENKVKKFVFKIICAFLFYYVPLLCQDGIHEHYGFFLRMMFGAGYAESVEKDVMGSDLKFYGATVPFRFQLGGSFAKNLIAYGEFGFASQTNPEMEWMGQSMSSSDITVSVGDLGLGITYYLMPVNIYFSLSGLYSSVQLKYNNTKSESDIEFEFFNGINVMVGKEWWVGNQWALGIAFYGYYSDMNVQTSIGGINNDYFIRNFSFGALISATFN